MEQAREKGEIAPVGRIFDICAEKLFGSLRADALALAWWGGMPPELHKWPFLSDSVVENQVKKSMNMLLAQYRFLGFLGLRPLGFRIRDIRVIGRLIGFGLRFI